MRRHVWTERGRELGLGGRTAQAIRLGWSGANRGLEYTSWMPTGPQTMFETNAGLEPGKQSFERPLMRGHGHLGIWKGLDCGPVNPKKICEWQITTKCKTQRDSL